MSEMISCPKCKASLPDWATSCQFCQADTSKVSRPVEVAKPKYKRELASWIWPAYYIIAILWIVSGVGGILEALNVGPFATTIKLQDVKIEPGVNLLGLIFSGVSAIIGLGLLVKIEIIRGVVNVVCFLQIVNGLLGLWAGIMASAFLGPIGLFITIMNIVDIVTGALMIYILGETD